jgi:hypothetical protein
MLETIHQKIASIQGAATGGSSSLMLVRESCSLGGESPVRVA